MCERTECAKVIWNKDRETMPREEMEKLQLERLQKMVAHAYTNVPFYHARLDEAGMTPDKILALEDLRFIPPTTKADLRDNYPYGLFGVPQSEVVRLHASSGTTGKPTVVGYTQGDLDVWSENVARLVTAAGATRDDIVQNCFGYGLFTGALGLHYGLEKIGASIVPCSSGNSEKQLMLMKDFGTTALIATPTYAMYLGEMAKELGYKREDFKLRLGLLGSEGCTTELRGQIEDSLGLFATDNYGLSELMGPGMSGECQQRDGLHINEDCFLCEILDPETLEPVPDGEVGELVVTTLVRECMPLLRYRTRDLTRIIKDPCACGRTTARMDKIMGRSDDMLKIRGVNVFPSQIESVLMNIDQTSPHYMLYVRREGYVDTLEVKVELTDASLLESYGNLERMRSQIQAKLATVLGLKAKVTLAEPKSIERFVGKARRIVDLRGQ